MIHTLLALLLISAPCEKAYVLGSGTATPCDGLLISEQAAQRCLGCMNVDLPQCIVDYKADAARNSAIEASLGERLEIQRSRGDALEQRLADIASRPPPTMEWYEHPAVWFVAGAVFTTVAGVAVIHGLDD